MLAKNKYPMVELVTYLIGLNDSYGVKHSERVAELCLRMGEAMELSQEDLEILELGALLHDIGKMAIPEMIRTKPGKLTEAETVLMRLHSAMGLDIIRRMNGAISPRVHQAIYHHHEDWSGTGYPAGLKGEAIPREARMIRIADTYDAITHSRGIRLPLDGPGALQLMVNEQEARQIFDPDLFRIFLQVIVD